MGGVHYLSPQLFRGLVETKSIPREGLGEKVAEFLRGLSSREPRLGDRRSLGPMMSSPLKESVEAFIEFIDRNLNDPSRFRESKVLEREVIEMVTSLLGGSEGAGLITYGGSESNITALLILRELGFRKVITPTSSHTSVSKAAHILGMKVIYTAVDSELRAVPEDIKAKVKGCSDCAVVLTAGNTETGVVDDALRVYEEVGDVPVHIDAAFGGLMIPFLRESNPSIPKADFTIPSVYSVSVDGHKAALTPIPSGALITRTRELMEKVRYRATYIEAGSQYGILWTRTAGSAAAFWASLMFFGVEGLRRLFTSMLTNAMYCRERLLDLGFDVVGPELPLICFRHREAGYRELKRGLADRGWYLYTCPIYGGLKITFMPHVTREVIDEFVEDLSKVLRV